MASAFKASSITSGTTSSASSSGGGTWTTSPTAYSTSTSLATNASVNNYISSASITPSNLTWTTGNYATTGYVTTADLGGLYIYGDTFTLFLSALPEAEIEKALDIVLTNTTKDEFERIIRTVVMDRHFSEEFLLKYNEYLTKGSIMTKHAENIKSREYASIALLLEEKDTEN